MPVYDNADLLTLTPEERRGALIALDHVRRRGEAIRRTGHADGPHVMTVDQRLALRQSGGLVCNIAQIVRRDMSPETARHNVDPI